MASSGIPKLKIFEELPDLQVTAWLFCAHAECTSKLMDQDDGERHLSTIWEPAYKSISERFEGQQGTFQNPVDANGRREQNEFYRNHFLVDDAYLMLKVESKRASARKIHGRRHQAKYYAKMMYTYTREANVLIDKREERLEKRREELEHIQVETEFITKYSADVEIRSADVKAQRDWVSEIRKKIISTEED